MAKTKSSDSLAEKVRAFLVARPDWTHARIADHLGTTSGYVDKVASQERRRGKSLPNRRAARQNAEPDPEGGEASTTSESVGVSASGLRLVTIDRLTPPTVRKAPVEAPEWACDQCGHKGTGKPPEACPKCGGA